MWNPKIVFYRIAEPLDRASLVVHFCKTMALDVGWDVLYQIWAAKSKFIKRIPKSKCKTSKIEICSVLYFEMDNTSRSSIKGI